MGQLRILGTKAQLLHTGEAFNRRAVIAGACIHKAPASSSQARRQAFTADNLAKVEAQSV